MAVTWYASRGSREQDMIDLHLHSTFSDGTCSPTELVEAAKSNNLVGLAITDHDTAAGTEEAMAAGDRAGIRIISGIELSVVYRDLHMHLLGYDFNWQEQRLAGVLRQLQAAREKRNRAIVAKLQEMGIEMDYEELRSLSTVGQTGRPHIARLLVAKKVVKSIDDAFAHYLKKGACAYVPRFICGAQEAIDLLHGAGGIAVLAHPGQISSSSPVLENLVESLTAVGLDGLETFYPTQHGTVLKNLRRLVKKYGLLETGGSDYHGDIRPGTSMAGGRTVRVPAELMDQLVADRRKRRTNPMR